MVGGTKLREEGAGEDDPDARARIPREPPSGDHGGAATSLQHMERTTLEQISTMQLRKGPCQCKWICPKGMVLTQEQFIPEELQPMRMIYTRRGKKHEKKGAERNCYILISPFVILLASPRVRWK